ncbi:MAG: hypothetical protein HY537_07825, partial [Deltaproteobacteria bacterium]|nr:hypothetical protein [Deltaproteobacteria bacterium]
SLSKQNLLNRLAAWDNHNFIEIKYMKKDGKAYATEVNIHHQTPVNPSDVVLTTR